MTTGFRIAAAGSDELTDRRAVGESSTGNDSHQISARFVCAYLESAGEVSRLSVWLKATLVMLQERASFPKKSLQRNCFDFLYDLTL